MKWKQWDVGFWVLEAENGEVLDEIKRDELSALYFLKSTGKKYTSEKAAKVAGEKGKKEQLQ